MPSAAVLAQAKALLNPGEEIFDSAKQAEEQKKRRKERTEEEKAEAINDRAAILGKLGILNS